MQYSRGIAEEEEEEKSDELCTMCRNERKKT